MKNLARASVFSTFILVGLMGTFACWPNAPIGGGVSDAAVQTIRDATGIEVPDGEGVSDAPSETGDAGEAGVAVQPVLPYASRLVATGIGFGCRIGQGADQGNVFCWGDDSFGQTGTAVVAPVPDASAGDAASEDGGDAGAAGDAGDGGGGEGGVPEGGTATDGGEAGAPDAGAPPVGYHQVAGISNATALALGDHHACAVTTSSQVLCWGLNNAHQLGHATGDPTSCGVTRACNPTPTPVAGVPTAVSIAAAGAWTCMVATDGTVDCWGAAPATTGAQAPYTVTNLSGVTQLAVAVDHACALIAGSEVACWGYNPDGQTSPTTCDPDAGCTFEAGVPEGGAGLPSSNGVAAGIGFTCALVADSGVVTCVGENVVGELGHPPKTMGDVAEDAGTYNPMPTPVAVLGSVDELVAGGSESGTQVACAIVTPPPSGGNDSGTGAVITGGTVQCWGAIASDAGPGVPVAISGLPTAMNALGVPSQTTECGIASDLTTWCWDLAGGAPPRQIP
jgi:hypothetical protein